MRFFTSTRFLPMALSVLLFLSCNKTEDLITEPLSAFMPLQTGKYITYRLDSTVFTNFNTVEETHKYQSKHVIDAQLTDNQGRPAYRVYTYLRDSAGINPWTPNGSYFITPLDDQLEVIEDNLRFIKFHLPIRDGYSWKGNKYFPNNPYDGLNPSNNYDNYVFEWDYYYDGQVQPSETIQGITYQDVLTIKQADEFSDTPIYGEKIFGLEKYSKNIGLIYREYILWEKQDIPGGSGPTKKGFGIKKWMIDHN